MGAAQSATSSRPSQSSAQPQLQHGGPRHAWPALSNTLISGPRLAQGPAPACAAHASCEARRLLAPDPARGPQPCEGPTSSCPVQAHFAHQASKPPAMHAGP
ncbi:unnamed protein product [Prunus brigantina]